MVVLAGELLKLHVSARSASQLLSRTERVLSGSTRPLARVTIWNDVEDALAGKVKGPLGNTTSVEFAALPDKDTVKSTAAWVDGDELALTMNVAGMPLATTLAVETMLSATVACAPTSPPPAWRATALITRGDEPVDVFFASGGGPMVSPAVVWSPSW